MPAVSTMMLLIVLVSILLHGVNALQSLKTSSISRYSKLRAVSEVASGKYLYVQFHHYVKVHSTYFAILIHHHIHSIQTTVASLDSVISSAGNTLVVVDYSTTWCGPCKMVYPKYVELSDRVTDVVFLKCIGDASAEASALMKREGVRSVPAFHFWKNGVRLDVINGARIEDVEAMVVTNK